MIGNVAAHKLDIYPISEVAVSIQFGNSIDDNIIQQVNGFNNLLHQKPFAGMYQTVLAYTTLTIFFDPAVLMKSTLTGNNCYHKASNYLRQLHHEYVPSSKTTESHVVTIPVCYGGNFGPDLDYIAAHNQITTQEVINLHSAAIYKVYMIGFMPGFAYMGGLSNLLETPRKATPAKVPAGAVGIAGKQTGIYPLESPGGWQIIGQTPLQLFNAKRQPPALLKAGDRVTFEPISIPDFKKYGKT